ncbi:hypothetical protein BDW66DRAFT_162838 [Aspergillus desertorum]
MKFVIILAANGLRAENARSELQNQMQQYLLALQQTGTKWRHPRINDILFKASYHHKHSIHASPAREDCDDLNCDKNQKIRYREHSEAIRSSIYIGPIASADTVMKSGQLRDGIARKEKVIGYEMEGTGVWDNIPCIIIKGVCDYADSHKNKLWQAYAAAAGASAAKAFLDYWMPGNHKDGSRNRHLMIPFARNPQFVGRQEEIRKLEDLISMPDGPKKTQIALELAYRMREREPDYSIFWIPCTSYEAVEQACMTIAQMVGLEDVQPTEAKERLKTYFSQTNNKWILVFDNADQMDMWIKGSSTTPPLKNIIPQSENGHVLFTSRNQKLAMKLASPNILFVPDVDQRTAKEIFRKLLIRKDLLHDDYNDISLGRSAIGLLGEEFEDEGRYAGVQTTVATTWLISFLEIQQVDELASDYLSFLACINRRDIPESILPSTTSSKRRVEALGLLKAYSFISAQIDDRTFDSWVAKAAGQLDRTFPSDSHNNRQVWSEEFQAHQDNYDDFLARIGRCLRSDGRYDKAETLFLNVLGLEHPDTLTSVSQLGLVLARQGKYKEAEAMHQQALKSRETVLGSEHPHTLISASQLGSVLGPEHPDTLTSMHNLALTFRQLGKISDALSLIKKCADLRNKVLGSDHPDAISSSDALSDWEMAANQLSESRKWRLS